MEAVLAMMVVICGVMLVTMSLAFVGIDLRRDSGETALQDGASALTDQFFSLGRAILRRAEVLQNSSLPPFELVASFTSAPGKGYCHDVAGHHGGFHLHGPAADRGDDLGNDTRSSSLPVLLSV